tara:strand:+ start:873 stop:1262 length:390 start_codon:yes stop_codon:yes gene_type:complete
MNQVLLNIDGLEMVSFDPSNYNAKMNLFYAVDGEKFVQKVNFDLTRKSNLLASSVISYVKSQGEMEIDKDNFVDSLFVKKLINEEKIDEMLFMYFSKLCEKVRFLKINKNHSDYMKLYDEIKTSCLSLR